MVEAEDPNLIARYTNAPSTGQVKPPSILAMGVGGGGCNAVAYMSQQGVQGVDFVALNTDGQALDPIPINTKILLGPVICEGLGAGGRPEIGQAAAEESEPEIEKLLSPEVKMVFVTAGMGGGTGTGAAPVVANIAKKRGVLTVGIVTIPFLFEGLEKIRSAIDGAARLQSNVDALLLINNDRLATIYPDMAWEDAFSKADDILCTAARTISDMVTKRGNINTDMRDVDTCLRNGRTALISVGYGEGTDRMQKAIADALHSPLLCDTNIMTAKELLFGFYYSHDLTPRLSVAEANQATNLVKEINKSVHIKFGWGFDDTLGDKLKFAILASGFDVSVDTAGQTTIIEGNTSASARSNDDLSAIAAAYGQDKVEDIIRRQETQNYYILAPEELDNDELITQIEATPAYNRDKRKVTRDAQKRRNAEQASRNQGAVSDTIQFSLED